MAGPEYGRAAPTLAGPSYDQFPGGSIAYRQYGTENPQGNVKAKRRESSMFGMNIGLGQRKPSNNKLRDDSRKPIHVDHLQVRSNLTANRPS